MEDNKKGSGSGSSLGFFGSIGAFVGRVIKPQDQSKPEPKYKGKEAREEKVIVIPEGRIRPQMENGLGFIGGLSELLKEKGRPQQHDTMNRLHALELLYENENDDGKEKLEEIEAVQSIFEDPGNEVNIEKIAGRKTKKANMKKNKAHERKSSSDSNNTV